MTVRYCCKVVKKLRRNRCWSTRVSRRRETSSVCDVFNQLGDGLAIVIEEPAYVMGRF